jgi:hypothetical protein
VLSWLKGKLAPSSSASGLIHVPGQQTRGMDRSKAAAAAAAASPMNAVAMLGNWVELQVPWEHSEPFVGYVYMDSDAGLSAKGDRAGSQPLGTCIVRLPMPFPWRVLDSAEISNAGLPAVPEWLKHYGPQPDIKAPWRSDPIMLGAAHESFIDDVQVIVHDGEPRRTSRQLEHCWVRVLSAKQMAPRTVIFNEAAAKMDAAAFDVKYSGTRFVYTGRLISQPTQLTTIKAGDELTFVSAEGVNKPVRVTEKYIQECARWHFQPCSKCGMVETLDPPSVMARTRFPDTPAGADVRSFTSFCMNCGKEGMQMLSLESG